MTYQRNARGNVSIEYVVLAGMLATILMSFFALPDALGNVMMGAGANMSRGDGIVDAGEPTPPAPGVTDDEPGGESTTPPVATNDEPFGEDPFSDPPGTGKSNNGHGNNADGVDVSNPGKGHGGPNGQVDPSGSVDDEISKGNGKKK